MDLQLRLQRGFAALGLALTLLYPITCLYLQPKFLAFRAAECGGEVEQHWTLAAEKFVSAALAILSDLFLLAAKQRAPLSWIRLGNGGGKQAGTGVRDWSKSGVAALYRRISRYLSRSRVYGSSEDERVDDDDDDAADDDEEDNWCSACDAEKPSRVHHCDACGRCVVGMDHHCTILSCCIGLYNRPIFIAWLASLSALSSMAAWSSAQAFFVCGVRGMGDGVSALSMCDVQRCIDAGALPSLTALPLSVSVWLQASGMLAFQLVLACQGLTTYEAFNGAAAAAAGGGGGGGGGGLEGSSGRLGLILRNFKAMLFPRSSPLAVHFGDHAPRKQAKSD